MNYTKGKWSLTGRDANGAVNVFTDKETIATVRHEYDAQLISASPLMYEALKEAEHLIRDREYASAINFNVVKAKIDKALTKAEGKDDNLV